MGHTVPLPAMPWRVSCNLCLPSIRRMPTSRTDMLSDGVQFTYPDKVCDAPTMTEVAWFSPNVIENPFCLGHLSMVIFTAEELGLTKWNSRVVVQLRSTQPNPTHTAPWNFSQITVAVVPDTLPPCATYLVGNNLSTVLPRLGPAFAWFSLSKNIFLHAVVGSRATERELNIVMKESNNHKQWQWQWCLPQPNGYKT